MLQIVRLLAILSVLGLTAIPTAIAFAQPSSGSDEQPVDEDDQVVRFTFDITNAITGELMGRVSIPFLTEEG